MGAAPIPRRYMPKKIREMARSKSAIFFVFPFVVFVNRVVTVSIRGAHDVTFKLTKNIAIIPPALAPIMTTIAPEYGKSPASTRPTAKDVATTLLCDKAESRTPKKQAPVREAVIFKRYELAEPDKTSRQKRDVSSTA